MLENLRLQLRQAVSKSHVRYFVNHGHIQVVPASHQLHVLLGDCRQAESLLKRGAALAAHCDIERQPVAHLLQRIIVVVNVSPMLSMTAPLR